MTATDLHNRPLVTFAVFAYNQERYIREAVEGAFAQTYEPLEIILSDDCSRDRTFNIMQDMAANYKGPHVVRVRRNANNIATFGHLMSVCRESAGEYIVVAAGDDISHAERTTKIVSFMLRNRLSAASSIAERFAGEGGNNRSLGLTTPIYTRYDRIFSDRSVVRIHGATAAYRKSALPLDIPVTQRLLTEDTVLETYFAWAAERVEFLHENLIYYRVHADNTSHRMAADSSSEIANSEIRLCRMKGEAAKSIEFLMECIIREDAELHNETNREILLRASRKLSYLRKRMEWYDLSLFQRIRIFREFNYYDGFFGGLSRLMGMKAYVTTKKTINLIKQSGN
ncbi:glycosyltransferase [Aurantimonas aggregata]|uniref:Glycosyltransferase n=1 Tax=Aurantimonas aggregata TaxID=2047720 RepID=A0A6L9MNS3_9HYPH|nr:glycosyltransferase [Aurantimonas aggregata]NDV89038.1 glycosyltransferase [Aurantimonas aggregata]